MYLVMKRRSEDEQRWSLVASRSFSADGKFVYAVKSTGIFCRPSCPSRRPRREQVEFFESPGEAQQAGYRPCRRCTPLRANAQFEIIEHACRYIEQNLETTLRLEQIAAHAGLSPFHFQRLFKRTLGISPRQYQQARRTGKFRQALHGNGTITDAIYEAGYSSSSRAYENTNAQLGMTPSAFRRRGSGISISYTIAGSALGKVLVATTSRGVCAVRFGDSERELAAELQSEFSAAAIKRDDNALGPVAAKVITAFTEGTQSGSIPLDIRGTAFQQRVWNALRQIPRGETRSYSEIAQAIGAPTAVRAVANACASNPVAVVIPCHRVVQKNGALAGYRWGVKRKDELLRVERTPAGRQAQTEKHAR